MKYFFSFQNSLFTLLSYRTNFWVRIFTTLLSIGMSVFMWQAIYKFSGQETVAGIGQANMSLYLVIVNILTLVFSTEPIFRLSALIRSGNLSVMLLRPVNILMQGFFEYLGRSFPYLLIYMGVFWVVKPISNLLVGLGSLGLFLTIYVMFYMLVTLMGLSSFWLIQIWPMQPVFNACFFLLGGQLFPLQVLPKNFRWLLYNPFSLAGNQLTMLSIGDMSEEEFFRSFLWALIWILLLGVLIHLFWKRGNLRYEGVGM